MPDTIKLRNIRKLKALHEKTPGVRNPCSFRTAYTDAGGFAFEVNGEHGSVQGWGHYSTHASDTGVVTTTLWGRQLAQQSGSAQLLSIVDSHTGGAVPLRFLVKTATTVSVFYYFCIVFPMCFSSRCYCGTRAESRRNHGGVTADMAIPLSYHCGLMAVPRRSLAAALRGQWGATAGLAVLLGWRCGSRAAPW